MKLVSIRSSRRSSPRSWVLAGLAGACAVGLLTSGVGCGGDSGTSTGKGGSGGSSTGTGGSTGSGGSSTGTGGSSTGAGGSSVTHVLNYTFDSSDQGFKLNPYDDPSNLARMVADGGTPDAGTSAGMAFDSTDGSPSPGALKITATWTANGQILEPILGLSPGLDLSGNKMLHAKVKVVSSSATFPGGVQFFIKTGAEYVYSSNTGTSLGAATVGAWTDLLFDTSIALPADATKTLDLKDVREIGLHFYTEGTPATPPTYPITTVFEVDTITD